MAKYLRETYWRYNFSNDILQNKLNQHAPFYCANLIMKNSHKIRI